MAPFLPSAPAAQQPSNLSQAQAGPALAAHGLTLLSYQTGSHRAGGWAKAHARRADGSDVFVYAEGLAATPANLVRGLLNNQLINSENSEKLPPL